MEQHSAIGRCLRVIQCRHGCSILHNTIGTNIGPPINLGTAVIHLANGDTTNFGLHFGHGKLVPLTMVIVSANIVLGIHALQEEVIGLPHYQAFERYFAALRRLGLLHRLGTHLFWSRIVEYRYKRNFIGIPAYNSRSFGNRGSLNIAEQGTFIIRRQNLGKALNRYQKLCRKVDTSFRFSIIFPVIFQGHIRKIAAHQGASRTPVFVRLSTSIVSIWVRSSVMRMVLVLVTGPHQERDIPGVCTQGIINIFKSKVEIRLFFGPLRKYFRQHKDSVCCPHIVTIKPPRCGIKNIIWRDSMNRPPSIVPYNLIALRTVSSCTSQGVCRSLYKGITFQFAHIVC